MFRGSMVALVTPFEYGEVDVVRFRALIEWHIRAGTHALVVAGTTGEAATLSYTEKCFLIKTALEIANERIPVIAGTAANATRDCIELTQFALSCGAHAALIMTPAYIRPTQAGLIAHYKAVAAAVGIPIILYNVPSRTAVDLLPESVAELANVSNIIGIKEASSEGERLKELLLLSEGRLDIYSGDDATAAAWMMKGAKGVISVTANVMPKEMAQLADAAMDGDDVLVFKLQQQLLPMMQALFVETNPIAVKWVLAKMGLIRDELRLPLTSLSSTYHNELRELFKCAN